MTNLDKICYKLMDSNHELKAKCALFEEENKQLREENKELKDLVNEVDNELEIRDIVCGAGKFRLEEWGKHRYHQFYKGDEELEDETVVIMLMELEKENKELKEINQDNQDYISSLEEEKNNLQIKLQKIRDYAMEDGEVKQGVIEKVILNDWETI